MGVGLVIQLLVGLYILCLSALIGVVTVLPIPYSRPSEASGGGSSNWIPAPPHVEP